MKPGTPLMIGTAPLIFCASSSALPALALNCRRAAYMAFLPALLPQGDPDRNVIRRLLLGPHRLVDRGRDQPVGGLWRQDEVVDADPVVTLPGAGLVVPERVDAGVVGGGAQRVGQPERHEFLE